MMQTMDSVRARLPHGEIVTHEGSNDDPGPLGDAVLGMEPEMVNLE
jgi:hypothetical protein